jgi:trans-AT polyketide synthase/acyltransferase/oxidoreductase domain-containing protein
MYKAISSEALVVRMGRAGLLGFFGTGGQRRHEVESAIKTIQAQLGPDQPYGINLIAELGDPQREDIVVDLALAHGVRRIEAAGFVRMTPSLVRYRVSHLLRQPDGAVTAPHLVLAKVSRPEVATAFLHPPPPDIVNELVAAGKVTSESAALARHLPMADDICVEADSGGHTDQRSALALLPAMVALRDRTVQRLGYRKRVRIGLAGGLGSPAAVAAAFVMGADFVLTGSINQCTVEAGTSDAAKDLLAQAEVEDTTMAPAGDMFEIGAKVQVLKRGLFFPARANHLYELYQRHGSIAELDPKTADQIQRRYFRRTFEDVWQETSAFFQCHAPAELAAAKENPKRKLALIFKWYFVQSMRLAIQGALEQRADFQIQCGPAMGAFNQVVRGTPLEDWRHRHVDHIAELLMTGAAQVLRRFLDHACRADQRPVRLGGCPVPFPREPDR